MSDRPKCRKPCPTCPFRSENHDQTTPDFATVNEWEDRGGWYGLYNLRRAWDGIRHGEGFNCHATDPSQNSNVTDDSRKNWACVGAAYLVLTQLQDFQTSLDEGVDVDSFFEDREDFQYVTRNGLYSWGTMVRFQGVPLLGSLIFPDEYLDCGTISLPDELIGNPYDIMEMDL